MDFKKLETGIKACALFSILERIRMVLILLAFFGEILLLNVSLQIQSLGILTNFPVIFGWFFTSEFRNELKIHREELTTGGPLYPLPPSNSFSGWDVQQPLNGSSSTTNGHGQGRLPSIVERENREFSETMAYSAPGIALYMNNLMR